MTKTRSTVNDGLKNQLETFFLTNFRWFWALVQSIGVVRRWINRWLINQAIHKAPTRPHVLSTLTPYTSWDSLTDRTYSGRHLPPVEGDESTLPPAEEVAQALFARRGEIIVCPKSTVLFSYFAQWFTDGFLRIDRFDWLKNTSNHDIDISPLYGINRQITNLLRSHQDGKLKSQIIQGEEYPPYAFQAGVLKEEFYSSVKNFSLEVGYPESLDPAKRAKLFAMGKERGNVQIGYLMMNTLFLREHNRICDLLAAANPTWDDERLFQTARNILIVLLIKIVVEEYINHIAPYHFKFLADPTAFKNEKWYRQNWMTLEFNLLYRWHSLVPDLITFKDQTFALEQTQWNTELLTSQGLGVWFEAASQQPAGKIGLLNTTHSLIPAEINSIKIGRKAQLASYNDYRELCQFPRVTDFNQITANEIVQAELRRLYGQVDRIELYVGLFAEDTRKNSAVGALIGRLVGVDAFSQALTNPLLAQPIFNEKTFTSLGVEIINATHNLSEILHRNLPTQNQKFQVTMTRQ